MEKFISIKYKMLFFISIITVLISLFIILYFPKRFNAILEKSLIKEALSLSELISYKSAEGVEFGDQKSVLEVFHAASKNKKLVYSIVIKPDGKVFTALNEEKASKIERKLDVKESEFSFQKGVLNVFTPILYQNKPLGVLMTGYSTDELIADKNSNLKVISVICFLILFLGLGYAFHIGNLLAKPIMKVTEITKQISEFNLNIESLDVKSRDEIGIMSKAFNEMVENFKFLAKQAQAIANNDLTNPILEKPIKGDLGKAFSFMTKRLKEVTEETQAQLIAAMTENEKQVWLSNGRSKLSDVIRGEMDIYNLAKNITSFLAKYLNAQIVTLYTLGEDNKLHLTGSYAFSMRKGLSNVIELGEGIVGQAALEKDLISITSIPEDYIRISSSIGESIPKNIVVIPFMYENVVKGVIELGSFIEFSDEEINFLKSVMEPIAIAFITAESNIKMKKLLEQTTQQAEILKSQQEELQATNEELEEQARILRESESKLKTQQEELQAINEELEEKTERLERQKAEIDKKNEILEKARKELQEKAKELEITSKYKSEFLANMSHELRTPLNSLLILAQDLASNKKGNLTQDQIESVEIIYKSGSDLLSLINEILDLSKIEAGKMTINIERVSLKEIANNIKINFRHIAENKGLRLNVIMDEEELPETINTDQQRLEQIIKNLMSNAIKFTEKGGVTVKIYRPDLSTNLSRSGLNPETTVAISVIDTGIGIPKDKQMDIFEAFQQVDGSTSRKYGGTGLGLSISRELAKLLGGEIGLESEEGKGSKFTLYVPEELVIDGKGNILPERRKGEDRRRLQDRRIKDKFEEDKENIDKRQILDRRVIVDRRRENLAPTKIKVREGDSAPSIKDDRDNITEDDRRILIIEDDLNFANTLYKFCHERGFKCLHAGDGETGLKLTDLYKPDAIILDIKLPGIDGWEVLDALKGNENTRHIPVHIVSVEDESIEAYKKGAIGYLTKPVDLKKLKEGFSKIENLISKKLKDLLVVEDDEDLRHSIIKLIENDNIKITAVGTGEEALKELTSKVFDCVILDLNLPDVSGFEILKEISKLEEIPIPPVIIYTGKDITREEEEQLREYASSIILKDVKSQERLLDETALFLHQVIKDLPEGKRKMIAKLYDKETILQGKKILLVDDDMRNVFAISKILEEKGMEVYKAADGSKALEILDKNPNIDLVLMDIMMPVMDGFETMRRIRAQERFWKLPILAITAKAMKEDRDKCISAGANDYLTKPVDIDKLLSLMRVWLYK